MAVRLATICLLLPLLAGCQLLADQQTPPDTTLWPLQVAIEGLLATEQSAAGHPGARPAGQVSDGNYNASTAAIPVAIMAVVDSNALTQAAEQGGSEQPLDSEALRRERLVQQAISGALVTNSLMEVIQPDQASIDRAREEIVAVNSAALSAPTAAELGEQLGAEVLVNALIDRQGAEVNIVAQRSADGKLVYQDTIKDWEILAAPTEAEE